MRMLECSADSLSENPVNLFVAALDNGEREALISHAENTDSIYEIWLYANVLGYTGSFEDLDEWVKSRFPKLNRRSMLQAEVIRLESDLHCLRSQVAADIVSPQDAAQRIAQLSKELRGHIVEIDKISKSVDRRGLILAGASRAIGIIEDVFRHEPVETRMAIKDAVKVVWAEMSNDR